jgi:hypothetical protein
MSPGGSKIFLISTSSRPFLGPTQPPVQWVPGVNTPGRETDHSPSSNAEAKNGGAMYPLPHTASWRSALLIKHWDNFTLQAGLGVTF